MNRFFVDAETEGLYGDVIAIGAVVVNETGSEIDSSGGNIMGELSYRYHTFLFPFIWNDVGKSQ